LYTGGFVRCQMEDELHGVCGTRGRGENAYRVLVWNREGEKPLGKTKA
jgi:hypothetical protein